MKISYVLKGLDQMVSNPICELTYHKDYELLIATVLSAQSTDRRVNEVTKVLFSKYDIYSLAQAEITDIESIIKSVGTFKRKSVYIIEIAKRLLKDYNGIVPNNRAYLEKLPGVGRKTCNVVLSEIYNVPAIAVDTHVERCAKRLGLVSKEDDVLEIEKKLMRLIPKTEWSRFHLQFVLFGRYICKSKNPNCSICKFNYICSIKNNR